MLRGTQHTLESRERISRDTSRHYAAEALAAADPEPSVPEPGESLTAWLRRTAIFTPLDDLDEIQLVFRQHLRRWMRAKADYPPDTHAYADCRRDTYASCRIVLRSMHIRREDAEEIARAAITLAPDPEPIPDDLEAVA